VSSQEDSADLQKGFCAHKEWSDCWLLQEGQHPLTGQRAANFRLLAN